MLMLADFLKSSTARRVGAKSEQAPESPPADLNPFHNNFKNGKGLNSVSKFLSFRRF
jgi:hypothetical protein